MPRLSPSSQRLLDRMSGVGPDTDMQRHLPRAVGPTLYKIEDPLEAIEDVAQRLVAGGTGRPPNKWMQRQAGIVHGLEMRDCCVRYATELNRQVHRLVIPTDNLVCSECGTRWGLEYRVREERRHE